VAFPATPLDVEVSLALSADLSDPDSWSWTDITDYVREGNRIRIRRGRSSERSTIPPSRCTLTVDNTDGRFCRLLPTGAWYGQIGPNTPIRVRVNNGSGYVTRFVGYVSGWPPSWDPSESDQTVTLVADGILRRLGQGRVQRSAMYRTMAGVAPGDYVPHAYWPMEDEPDALSFASAIPGRPALAAGGDIEPGSDDTLAGSGALATLTATDTVAFTIPDYTNAGQCVVQWVTKIPTEPGAEVTLAEFTGTGGPVNKWRVTCVPGSPTNIWIYDLNSAGTVVNSTGIPLDGSSTHNPSEADFYGHWAMMTFAIEQIGAFVDHWLGVTVDPTDGGVSAANAAAGTAGKLTGGTFYGAATPSLGHVVVYTDPAFDAGSGGDAANNAAALAGYSGEMAHERVERLCREERIPVTVTATTSQAMGPQGTATTVALLRECATTDFGLLYEPSDAAGLAYLSSTERYNQAAAITLQYDQGHVSPPWDPTDDDRDTRNDVTASRRDGSSARVTDEASIAAIGVYDDTLSVSAASDEQLGNIAGWAVNLGTIDELRWPAVKPNFLDHPSLIDDWMAADLGSQLHVTGHPSPLAPDEIQQIIEGYDETFGSYEYTVVANLSPASGWIVGEYDDDDLGKLDTAGCVMQAGATSGATSFTVATTVLPRWTTDAGEMPIPILVSGQVNSVTAISNVAPSFVAAGTVAHGNNASVTPGMPAGVQAGDLLLVFAAIRNSGTGMPDTPTGYTLLRNLTGDPAQPRNAALYAKVHTGTESAPQVTFTGGAANADTSAQMAAFRGVGITVHASAGQLNGSVQDIAYPALDISRDNCAVIYLGWKQDDWTSVASPGTEIGEPDTTTGDDQGIVWAYTLQTTATAIASGVFTVTGGASAVSRSAVVALATDVQTMTVTRGTNGVTKAIPIGSQVNVYRPARLAL
jgi:hypothetical protein